MPRRYNAERHNELVAEDGRLTASIDTIRSQLLEYVETDTPPDSAGQARYMARADEYHRLRDERRDVRAEIRDMELSQPQNRRAEPSMLTRFLRHGFNGMTVEEREEVRADLPQDAPIPEGASGFGVEGITIQAQTRSDDASGQELVEETVVPEVVERLADYGGLDRMARRIVTGSGNDLRFPQADNSAKKGRILANQNAAVAANAMANFGVVPFGARTCTSDSIIITREMLVDSIFDVGAYGQQEALRRMGRSWDDEFTDEGDGAGGRARSLKNSTTMGADQITADTIVYEDILNLIYSVNRAYRTRGEMGEGGRMAEMGTVGFLVTDGGEKSWMSIKDGEDRPMWMPSIREGAPDRMFRYPYQVTTAIEADHMSAAGTAYCWFGHFGYYGIRTVGSVEIFRFFDSRTAQNNAIEILGFSRRDARAMGAQGGGAAGTTEAIKFLQSK